MPNHRRPAGPVNRVGHCQSQSDKYFAQSWTAPNCILHFIRLFPFESSWHDIGYKHSMPNQATIQRARRDAREGKAPSTQAGEFVREEFHHIREGKHGARSAKQAIAIGLSKARRAGVKLPPPARGKATAKIRRQAERDYAKGTQTAGRQVSARRSRATLQALRREEGSAASTRAISRQSRAAARGRTASQRSAAGRKAVRTKGRNGLSAAAKKAARTRLITETLNIL